jgi:16S rRNA G1207 methylase RsmC
VPDRQISLFHSLMMLALESNRVVALRCMKLMLGGSKARREAELMLSEKIDAAIQAGTRLMAGASGHEIVRRYRRRVAANAKRLGRTKRRTRRRK